VDIRGTSRYLLESFAGDAGANLPGMFRAAQVQDDAVAIPVAVDR
jgi:hypothetical protein